MKTIIYSLTNSVCNVESDNTNNFWGLGDVVRGMCCVYQICKKLNYSFIIDIQHHPISLFLKQRTHDYEEYIKSNKNNIPFIFPCNTENYILNNNENIMFFMTNDSYNGEVDIACKELLKDLFTPNETFQKYIDSKLLNINLKDYSVIHFRLGDDYLVRKIIDMKLISHCYNIFKNNKEDNQILLTDNDFFKKLLKNKENAFTFDTNLAHVGYKEHEKIIQDTLFEFIVLLNVNKIKHYSVYGWKSGFINTANIINNIKLIKI